MEEEDDSHRDVESNRSPSDKHGEDATTGVSESSRVANQHGCTICELAFSSKSNRVRHERTAHGNVRFACPICETDLSSNERVKKHMARCIGLVKTVRRGSTSGNRTNTVDSDGNGELQDDNTNSGISNTNSTTSKVPRLQLNIEDTSRLTEHGHTNPSKGVPDDTFEMLASPFLNYLKQTPTTGKSIYTLSFT